MSSSPDLADLEVQALARRMFYRRFSRRIEAVGIEADDAIQVVLLGLLTRSRSVRSRWDPLRSTLSAWVYNGVRCLVLNMMDQQRRYERRAGVVGGSTDAALLALAVEEEAGEIMP